MNKLTYFALVASTQAVNLIDKHACDFIDDAGEEISTSLMPENVQLEEQSGNVLLSDANEKHACDFIDDSGEEISTSLMPENV